MSLVKTIPGFIEDAESGKYTRKQMATKYNVFVYDIRNFEKSNQSKFIRGKAGTRMSNETKQEILRLAPYHTIREIALKFGLQIELLRNMKARQNVPFLKRRTSFNIDFFKQHSAELGYVLGWIASDGCISNGQVTIGLKATDHHILDTIKRLTDSALPIIYGDKLDTRTNRIYKYARIAFYSLELVALLKQYKLEERKSLTLEWPELPEVMLVPYIRGFLDGDGTIVKNARGQYKIAFCGPKPFLTDMLKAMQERFCIDAGCITPNGKISSLQFNGNVITKTLLTKLYEGSTEDTRLDRKYQRFEKLLDEVKSDAKPWIRNNYTPEFHDDLANGMTAMELAKKYNFKYGTVRLYKQKWETQKSS